MRGFLSVCIGLIVVAAIPIVAAPSQSTWHLPDGELQALLTRVRAVVDQRGWTVTADGNEITISLREPVAMRHHPPGAASAEEAQAGVPAGELLLKLTLRFAPKLSSVEYERLAAANAASDVKRDKLHRAVGLSHKFDDFVWSTPEEKSRVEDYHRAVSQLLRHDLPDFYTPEYSVHFLHHWHAWSSPADDAVAKEWMRIEEQLTRSFGMYDPQAVANRTTVGQYLEDRPH